MLTSGDNLGRYRIESLLGEGGMGAVYRAQDSTLRRAVAIKVLRREIGSLDVRERLLREAQSASALNHPNICTVYEVGEDGDWTFIAMEYVDGRALSTRLEKGPLDVHEALRHGMEISDALAHAHERGVVHRDLKAANAMLSSSGRLKIVDFGLARRLDPLMTEASTLASLVQPGTTAGTPYAMAPEQVRGEPADARTDVWALGVLLYEMVTAARPFGGATLPELFASILRDPYTPLPHTRALAPLRKVIDTCLAKDAGRRYQHALEARLALEEIAAGSRRDIVVPPAGTATAGAPVPPSPLLERSPGETSFVGRGRERDQLAQMWDRAKTGRRQLCLLAGEPGIGKTRLALEFARSRLDEHATVLIGRCSEEALVPYQPFVEALGWYARTCLDTDLRTQLAAVGGGGELGPIVPDLARRLPDMPPPTAMNPEGQRYRLFETVNALVGIISAAHPVVLLFDDLHWADKPTLSLLRHIVRAPDRAALCVIGTYRESDLDRMHPLAETLADLRREPAVTRISLAGLDSAQVAALAETVTRSTVPETLAHQVAESTDGNPFFVGEMLRHLTETGALERIHAAPRAAMSVADLGLPEGIREVIGRRLSRLSEACNRTLSLASIIGREFDLGVLEAVGDLREDQLLDVIDEAERAQLIDEAPGRPGHYSFHHALIRSTLYDELTASRRVRLHRRIGEAIERLAGATADPPLSDLAYHFVQAAPTGVAEKAADYATRAGDRMAERLAHEEAGRFYDLALQALDTQTSPEAEVRRVVLHRRRAKAFGALALWAPQKAALEEALAHLESTQAEQRSEILSELAGAHFWLLDIPAGERAVTEALALAERIGRADIAANALGWLARCRMAGRTPLDGIEVDSIALARYGSAARISHVFGPLNLYLAGRATEAVALSTRAAQMVDSSHDTGFTMNALTHHALSLAAIGRYADAARVFREVREFGRRYGVTPLLARATSMSGGFHLSLFDVEGAEAIETEARELALSGDFVPTIVSAGIDLLLSAARRHAPGGVEKLLADTEAGAARMPGWHEWLWRLRLAQARAELALARAEWDSAIHAATAGITLSHERVRPKYEALGLATRAQALHETSRTREAIADARRAVEIARRIEDPALLVRALDLLLQIEGDDDLAAEARVTVDRIDGALAEDELRRRFRASEVVGRVRRL